MRTNPNTGTYVHVLVLTYQSTNTTLVIGVYRTQEEAFIAASKDHARFTNTAAAQKDVKPCVNVSSEGYATIRMKLAGKTLRTYRIQRYKMSEQPETTKP